MEYDMEYDMEYHGIISHTTTNIKWTSYATIIICTVTKLIIYT